MDKTNTPKGETMLTTESRHIRCIICGQEDSLERLHFVWWGSETRLMLAHEACAMDVSLIYSQDNHRLNKRWHFFTMFGRVVTAHYACKILSKVASNTTKFIEETTPKEPKDTVDTKPQERTPLLN